MLYLVLFPGINTYAADFYDKKNQWRKTAAKAPAKKKAQPGKRSTLSVNNFKSEIIFADCERLNC
jgi:hypothetical protein